MLRWEVEIGFDTSEGDANGFGGRETEIELEEFRERVLFGAAIGDTAVVYFRTVVAPCVEGVLIGRESGAEVDSNTEDVYVGFIFFLSSVEAYTDIAFGSVFTDGTDIASAEILSVFVKNFVFVHKFTSKIVRIIAFERL